MLKYVSRVTESHVSVIHHNRRLPAGARDTGTPADQIRGPAAFTNASRWACAMDPYRGKRRINWHRVSFGPTPPDSYFAIDAAGLPHDDTAPEAVARVGEDNRARVLAAIPAVGGITRKEIEVATDLSESAVGDHLRALVAAGLVIKVQAGKTTSYHLPISRPPERTIFGSES
jgi:DNA-binding transcriptional ArsR family regulator